MATPIRRYCRGGAHAYSDHFTRDMWLSAILRGAGFFNVQPPDYWFRIQQNEEGRSIKTAASIWYRNYPPERKMIIWDMAPEEDFIARGYLK